MDYNQEMDYNQKYESWLNSPYIDGKTKDELRTINTSEIEDRFYKDLEFGTGGLRGIIGAGSNRMNIYTVGKATQGLANFLLSKYKKSIGRGEALSVAIGFDSRIMSKEFAKNASLILCANGIKTFLFDSLRPTPVVSFAVRHLECHAGIMITASHNPKEYNGYKVYGPDGGQITDAAAKEILGFIKGIQSFSDIKKITENEAKNAGLLNIIDESLDQAYIEKVKGLSLRKELITNHARELNIIYTPLHGTGNVPVRRVLSELGYINLNIVKEQELPDGSFPTAPYPNPEDPKVFEIALKMADKIKPDIIFGTDPDCDRIGVVVKDKEGGYKALTGNQIGVLLTHYILNSMSDYKSLPENGVIIKTIVTTDMAKKIAEDFKCETIDVLTGFKYIGEKIKEFEENHNNKFIFGFEESYGYLAGSFVRDKDAVIASMLVCEMALYYKLNNMSLYDALQQLYNKYGYFKEELVSIKLEGREGAKKIEKSLDYLRNFKESALGTLNIQKVMDYKTGIIRNITDNTESKSGLPESNVMKFIFSDNSWFVVRPSGTEPKMKIYLSVTGKDSEDSYRKMESFKSTIMQLIDKACNA